MSTAGTKRKGSEKATPEEEESDADQQEGRAEGKDAKMTAKPVDIDKEEEEKVVEQKKPSARTLGKTGGKKAKSVKVVPKKAADDEEEKKEPVPEKAAKKGASTEAPVDKTSDNLPTLVEPANKDKKTDCCVTSCSQEHKGKGKVKEACMCAKCEKQMCDAKDCRVHFSGKNADICTNCAGVYVCVCVCVWVYGCVCVCVCVSLFFLCVC
jgi:hypothetical protein